MRIDLEQAKRVLQVRERDVIPLELLRPAAVLIPYYEKDGEGHLVLTKRSSTVDTHKGQVAFPGGKQEEGEDLLTTALRETHEELGISPDDVEIIGPLDDIVTISDFRVTPYFGRIPHPYDYVLSEDEIESVFATPLSALMDDGNLVKNIITHEGNQYATYYFDWDGYTIWGATGRIVVQFLKLFFGKDF